MDASGGHAGLAPETQGRNLSSGPNLIVRSRDPAFRIGVIASKWFKQLRTRHTFYRNQVCSKLSTKPPPTRRRILRADFPDVACSERRNAHISWISAGHCSHAGDGYLTDGNSLKGRSRGQQIRFSQVFPLRKKTST